MYRRALVWSCLPKKTISLELLVQPQHLHWRSIDSEVVANDYSGVSSSDTCISCETVSTPLLPGFAQPQDTQ